MEDFRFFLVPLVFLPLVGEGGRGVSYVVSALSGGNSSSGFPSSYTSQVSMVSFGRARFFGFGFFAFVFLVVFFGSVKSVLLSKSLADFSLIAANSKKSA